MLQIADAAGYQSFDSITDTAIGARGWYLKMHLKQGTDLLFCDEGGIFFVEVKQPGEGQTARELVFMHLCAAFDILYYVIETDEQMTALLNGRR